MVSVDEKRKWLLAFGKKNGYPGIVFRSVATGIKYALGYEGSAEVWNMEVGVVNDDCATAAYEYLQSASTGEEDL